MPTRISRAAGLALVFAGIVALTAAEPALRTIDRPALMFLLSTSAGVWLAAGPSSLRWILAGIPWWVYANSSSLAMAMALGLTIGGTAVAAVGPLLPGRSRRFAGQPLAHLANGPLGQVPARSFLLGRRSRRLVVAAGVAGSVACILGVVAVAMEGEATSSGLAIAAAIMAVTFLFANWYAGRVSIRTDETGLHTRALLREHTLPWREVSALSLRYVLLGAGVRMVYYCVHSPTREVAFPGSMRGADELRTLIENATGLSWPAPEITPNF